LDAQVTFEGSQDQRECQKLIDEMRTYQTNLVGYSLGMFDTGPLVSNANMTAYLNCAWELLNKIRSIFDSKNRFEEPNDVFMKIYKGIAYEAMGFITTLMACHDEQGEELSKKLDRLRDIFDQVIFMTSSDVAPGFVI
jgi:hypothetical protein